MRFRDILVAALAEDSTNIPRHIDYQAMPWYIVKSSAEAAILFSMDRDGAVLRRQGMSVIYNERRAEGNERGRKNNKTFKPSCPLLSPHHKKHCFCLSFYKLLVLQACEMRALM